MQATFLTRVVLAAVHGLVAAPSVFALNPALDVAQYAHTAWKGREGFVRGVITSIAQTPDGYLWLGTDFGLVRFDGVRSAAWQPPAGQRLPSSEIHRVLAARDGSLWIATAKGLARWKDGRLTHIAQLAGQIVFPLMEDREGTVWAGTIALNDAKLCAIQLSVVQCHGGSGRFGNAVVGVREDRRGAVWVAVSGGMWRWKPGPPVFHPIPWSQDSLQTFEETDAGLLIGSLKGIVQLVDGNADPYPVPPIASQVRVKALLRDRHGGLWIGTGGQGIVHIHQGRADVFTMAQGLSGDAVTALFEDREGSVWVATAGGLDRFRDLAVSTFAVSQGLSSARVLAVLATRDGNVWVGTDRGLNQRRGSGFRPVPIDTALQPGAGVMIPNSLFEDSRGRVWISTGDGTGYVENHRWIAQRGVPGGAAVHAIAEDAEGGLWLAHQDAGLFRVSGDRTTHHRPWTTFGHQGFATALAADPVRGGVWIGFQNGGVVHFSDGRVRASYTVTDGVAAGRVNALRFDRDGTLWAATEAGLSRIDERRPATLTTREGLPCDGVHWSIEDDADSVWLYMPCGLVRIPAAELRAWPATAGEGRDRPRTVTVFDSSDGVTSRARTVGYNPRVAKSNDGRIWFTSTDGVSVVDPRRLPFNALAPPVYVQKIIADGRPYEAAAVAVPRALRLPALTRDLQIDYTALSLVAAEKVRFRYKLEGHDRDWHDAGNRRQAFYTNLPPRDYRFRVAASNNSGVWNAAGAALVFSVAPAYHQTAWFAGLSIAALVAVLWGAHRVRLRIAEKHQHEISALNERLMMAQEQERIRIAGELHDGVMQDMLAVTMMLGTAKRRIPDTSDARATIDKAQQKLVHVGTDLRQLSHDLHPPLLQDAGLTGAMHAYCEQFSTTWGMPVECVADESVSELSRGAALALFRILQEALGNAAKHATATRIRVRLTRADGQVSLAVSDDGVGFAPTRLAGGGGLGLIMMRERAGQLNGTFEYDSAPGRGTRIRVTIPFR